MSRKIFRGSSVRFIRGVVVTGAVFMTTATAAATPAFGAGACVHAPAASPAHLNDQGDLGWQ